jgi:hypothetical protein
MRRAQDNLTIKAKFKVEFEVEEGAAALRHASWFNPYRPKPPTRRPHAGADSNASG